MDKVMTKLCEIQADIGRLQGTTYDRPHLMQVMVRHQRRDIVSCICGWGVDTGDLGKSHVGHVLDEYELERRLGERPNQS